MSPLPEETLNNMSNKPPAPNKFLIPKPIDSVGISIGRVNAKMYHFFPLILALVKKQATTVAKITDITAPASEYKIELRIDLPSLLWPKT